jgi:hypothetical protein
MATQVIQAEAASEKTQVLSRDEQTAASAAFIATDKFAATQKFTPTAAPAAPVDDPFEKTMVTRPPASGQ